MVLCFQKQITLICMKVHIIYYVWLHARERLNYLLYTYKPNSFLSNCFFNYTLVIPMPRHHQKGQVYLLHDVELAFFIQWDLWFPFLFRWDLFISWNLRLQSFIQWYLELICGVTPPPPTPPVLVLLITFPECAYGLMGTMKQAIIV